MIVSYQIKRGKIIIVPQLIVPIIELLFENKKVERCFERLKTTGKQILSRGKINISKENKNIENRDPSSKIIAEKHVGICCENLFLFQNYTLLYLDDVLHLAPQFFNWLTKYQENESTVVAIIK